MISTTVMERQDPAAGMSGSVLSLDAMEFVYEPFPVGCAAGVFAPEVYRDLLANWPGKDLFEFKAELGKKYSLSEVNNPEAYHRFIQSSPPWRRFYEWTKSAAFIKNVLRVLSSQSIDLGLQSAPINTVHHLSPWSQQLRLRVRKRLRRLTGHAGVLSTRFEYSMLPANGGCIKPHTDTPAKLITLVLSMVDDGAWDASWGGGTAILRPKDATRNFNFMNRQMDFAECQVLRTFPFQPNQCVLFIKTFNSHHAVYPMTGHGSEAMRQTLTINIERT
jgi:hypothetical protein